MKPNLKVVPRAPAACKPLLRWAGGKSWFVKEHGDSLFEEALKADQYIEPFIGGGAIALHFGLDNMLIADVEPDVIYTYYAIRDETESLANYLSILEEQGTDEENYYRVREKKAKTALSIAAKTIYLNVLCFNGIHRKNQSGQFNVPYGKKEKPMPTFLKLKEVADALRGAQIMQRDFEIPISRAKKGSLVVADPPYDGTFSDYSKGGFDHEDQHRLAVSLFEAGKRGAEFIAFNADSEYVRQLYGDWAQIYPMSERHNVNSKGDGRGVVGTVLITNMG